MNKINDPKNSLACMQIIREFNANYTKEGPNYKPTNENEASTNNVYHLTTSLPKIQCSKCFKEISDMSCHMVQGTMINSWAYVCNKCYSSNALVVQTQVGDIKCDSGGTSGYNPQFTIGPSQYLTRCSDCGMGTGFMFHYIPNGIGNYLILCGGCYAKRQAYPNTWTTDKSAEQSADTCKCVRCPHCNKVVK